MQNNSPIVWSIGGQDPCGAAGIQVDLATFSDFNCHGVAIPTLLTAQNFTTAEPILFCDPNFIAIQMQNVAKDFYPQVIKISALGKLEALEVIQKYLTSYQGVVIYDPVLITSTGCELTEANCYSAIIKLLPSIDLFTPNLVESSILLNKKIESTDDMIYAAEQFLSRGCKRVLIKGGHRNSPIAQDYFSDGRQKFWLNCHRTEYEVRGTGCRLSSATAACIASGAEWGDALVQARFYLQAKIRSSIAINNSRITTSKKVLLTQEDLPWVSQSAEFSPIKFNYCGDSPLGLYPIVDNADDVDEILKKGANTIQLRIKNSSAENLEKAIERSAGSAKKFQARLFINDYWQLAIKHGAYGVHLGQEDLESADVSAIAKSGLRLGISTHSYFEIARAHAFRPSYIAFGPIFPTTSKIMKFAPQGLESLHNICDMLSYPVVAIGGINQKNYSNVIATGVNGVAFISATKQFFKEKIC